MEPISIQVAVVAMLKEEANRLFSGAVFDNSVSADDRDQFEKLKYILQQDGFIDIIPCYDEKSRDQWKPLIADQVHIDEIAQDIVERLNQKFIKPNIRLHSLSSEFLSTDRRERSFARDNLRDEGGLLIVDAISMYHPWLRQAFLDSHLFGNNRIAMIVIPPIVSKNIMVYQLLEEQIYTRYMETAFFDFFDNHLNPFYEFGTNDIRNLRRWLFSSLPKLTPDKFRPSPEQQEAIREASGKNPRGYSKLVAGV
jgi:hypothetical protein